MRGTARRCAAIGLALFAGSSSSCRVPGEAEYGEIFVGVPTPRQSLVWLGGFGAGAGGVYTLVEQVDRKFLRTRFGEDDGHLFEIEQGADLTYAGGDGSSYDPQLYELKVGEAEPGYQHLADFVRALNWTPPDELAAALEPLLDVDGFLRALVVNTWLANFAAYPGAGGNVYLYSDAAGRFHYIPWDLNQAFGNYHGAPCDYSTDELLSLAPDQPGCGADRPLVDRLLAVSAIRARYRSLAAELVDTVLVPAAVISRMHELRDLLGGRGAEDILDDFSAEEFEASLTGDTPPGDDPERVPGLEDFVRQRDACFRSVLGLTSSEEQS